MIYNVCVLVCMCERERRCIGDDDYELLVDKNKESLRDRGEGVGQVVGRGKRRRAPRERMLKAPPSAYYVCIWCSQVGTHSQLCKLTYTHTNRNVRVLVYWKQWRWMGEGNKALFRLIIWELSSRNQWFFYRSYIKQIHKKNWKLTNKVEFSGKRIR